MIWILQAFAQNLISDADKQTILKYHNLARAEVGVAPLAWDTGLEGSALQCLQQTHPQAMQHGVCNNYPVLALSGENIAYGQSGPAATLMFIGEKCQNPGPTSLGHWSQVVWRDSTNLACAQVDQGGIIYCYYYPKGNINGTPAYTIPPSNNNCNGGALNNDVYKQQSAGF